MKHCTILTALVLCVFTTFAEAKPGIVRTKDGRSIEGEVTDKGPDGISITTRVGTVTLNRDDVQAIDYTTDINEAYKKRLAALPRGAGARDHLEIARWLYDQKAYDLARKELDTVLALEPTNEQAQTLRQTVDRQAILDKTKTATPTASHETTTAGPGARGGDRRLLNLDQINKIRQAEMRETDTRIHFKFDNDVKKRFADSQGITLKDFAAGTAFQQGLLILTKGTPEMRQDVRVLDDPQSIADFKRRIQPMLVQGCATNNCHSNGHAGDFVLYTPVDNDFVSYTNFYLLTQYRITVGGEKTEAASPFSPGGGPHKAIDRTYPANSILAQYGLPREMAEFRHPELPPGQFTPLFRNREDPKYQLLIAWIRNDLLAVEPDYRISDFALPWAGKASTRPASVDNGPIQPPPARTADTTPPRPNAQPADNGNSGDVRSKLDEARRRIRPTGGANSVPSPF